MSDLIEWPCSHDGAEITEYGKGEPLSYCRDCGASRSVEHVNIGKGWMKTHWRLPPKTADEIERLKQMEVENAKLQAVVDRQETAIRWALGESPDGTPKFPVVREQPYYRWRTQLRVLSGVRPLAALETDDE